MSGIEAGQPHESRRSIEAVEVHLGEARMSLRHLDRRIPEGVVAAEVRGGTSGRQPGILGLDGLPRLLLRFGEDGPDARRRSGEDVQPTGEQRALAIVRSDDQRNRMRPPVFEGIQRSFGQEVPVDHGAEADRARSMVGRSQLHSRRGPHEMLDVGGEEQFGRFFPARAVGARVVDLLAEQLEVLLRPLRGQLCGIHGVRRRALGDCAREEAPSTRNRHEGGHRVAAGRLPEEGDIARVAPESADIGAHPLERGHLIPQAEIVLESALSG